MKILAYGKGIEVLGCGCCAEDYTTPYSVELYPEEAALLNEADFDSGTTYNLERFPRIVAELDSDKINRLVFAFEDY